jgi:cytidylate kinase
MNNIKIAVDGPSGAGKSTISKAVARKFNITYVDTGSIFRAVAVYVSRMNVDYSDEFSLEQALNDVNLEIKNESDELKYFVNSVDVTNFLRTSEISKIASDISKFAAVREKIKALERNLAAEKSVIMDGRDIGTQILPDADLKIFLTASLEDRAMRRYYEFLDGGASTDLATVQRDMALRDKNDSSRDLAPLKPAADAKIVNTTGNTLDESVAVISKLVAETLSKLC